MTDAAEPAVSEEIADRWSAMGGGLEQAGILLQQAVFGSETGWTGQAADAMRYRLGQVADWSYNSGTTFTTASSAVREQSSAVGEAKNRMPEPVPYNPDQIIDQAAADGLLGIMALPQRMYEQRQKHDAAYEEAVHVVNARDLLLVQGAGTIPQFSPPPALNDDTGGSGGDDGGRRDSGGGSGVERGYFGGPGGGGGPSGGSVDGGGSGSATSVGGSGSFGSGSGSGSGSGTVGPGPVGPGPQVTTPGYTPKPTRPPEVPVGRPPGAAPSDFPVLGPGVGFVPGGGPGSGRGSGGGPARGFGSGAGGGPGRVPGGAAGMGPGGAAAAEAAGGGRGTAGARGGAGMGGMPLGAGRGQGDEDTEHERPSYLQEDDPEGLFGTDEKTAPPVLGLE